MSKNSKDEIVEGLEDALVRWEEKRSETKKLVAEFREYYAKSMEMTKEAVISQAKTDKGKIKEELKAHKDIAATAEALALDLRIQVESSERGVVKMRKHGRLAALGFTVLGAVIGLALGLKVPGLGQVIAVVAGTILGGFCFGCFALATYLIMSSRARRREKKWKEVEGDNKEGLRLEKVVVPKRTQLGEVYNVLNDLEEGNFNSTSKAIVTEMDDYMAEN